MYDQIKGMPDVQPGYMGSAQNMMIGGQLVQPETRKSDVEASLNEQRYAITSLEKLAETLIAKLAPITAPRPGNEKNSCGNPSACALSGAIRENTARIERLNQLFGSQIDSLEV